MSKADVDEVIRLAEWGRKNGFLIRDVKIGAVELQIADLRIAGLEGLKQSDPEQSIWQQHGLEDDPDDIGGTAG